MKTGFNDPISRKSGKEKKSPWNFQCPDYDERSSCYLNAGTNYGIGHRQPVGKEGKAVSRASTLPFGRVNTLETDSAPPKHLDQEFIE